MLAASLVVALLAFVAQPSAAGPLDHSKRDGQSTPHTLFARTSCGTSSESCVSSGSDSCCFEATNGLFTAPQFWDTDPVTGPANSWTIHGLWPDKCDGTYEESCDSSREYSDPTSILRTAGRTDLITYMTTFWLPNTGATPASLWKHEWDHHGTCMSTLESSCMPSGSATGTDAVYYWDTTVKLFKALPTYTWLAAAGITPSSSKTYTLSTLQAAIRSSWGYTPAFDCSSSEVYQVYYYFHLRGSSIDGTWVPINAPKAGSCPSSGIKYVPKSGATTTIGSTGTSSPTSTSTPPSTTIPTKSTISALTSSGSITGGLLSYGTWSVQTLATFTAAASGSGYTLTTSRGSCGVSSGTLSCGTGLTSTFTGTVSGSYLLLAYGGSTQFSANGVPSGTTQQTVYTGTTGSQLIQFIINAS